MIRLVLDASALLEYLINSVRGQKFAPILQAHDSDLHAPTLCDVELASGLVRLLVRKWISMERASDLLLDLNELPITRHGHLTLLPRAISLRNNFSVYDAVYVALAENLSATLLTADEKLAGAVRKHTSVEVVVSN
jgi:predicted nucleic acid-binding protein